MSKVVNPQNKKKSELYYQEKPILQKSFKTSILPILKAKRFKLCQNNAECVPTLRFRYYTRFNIQQKKHIVNTTVFITLNIC